jgi:hypothetical protein
LPEELTAILTIGELGVVLPFILVVVTKDGVTVVVAVFAVTLPELNTSFVFNVIVAKFVDLPDCGNTVLA